MYPKQFSPRVDDDDDELLIDLSARGHHTFDDGDDIDAPSQPHDPLAPLRPTHARACGQRARPH